MFVIPKMDQLVPAAGQQEVFHSLEVKNKQLQIEKGRGHLDILEGEGLPRLMKKKIQFIGEAVDRSVQ